MIPELSAYGRCRAWMDQQGLKMLLGSKWLQRRLARTRSEPIEGRTLDTSLAAMLRLDDLTGHSDLRKLSPHRARRRVAYDCLIVEAPPPSGIATSDHEIPGPAGPLALRLYCKDGLPPASPSVFYIHGGGFVTGSISTHDRWCRRIAHGASVRVTSIEYRLAPEHRFPAAVDDCLAGFRWVVAHASALGIDPARIALAGDSAGGNLSAVLSRLAEHDAYPPALQVLLYPALDATCSRPSYATFAEGFFLTRPICDWYYDHYLGDVDRAHPDVSPLLAANMPKVPALVYAVGFDPLRDEALDYAERLKASGTRVVLRDFRDLIHGFVFHNLSSEAARSAAETVIADIGNELRGA